MIQSFLKNHMFFIPPYWKISKDIKFKVQSTQIQNSFLKILNQLKIPFNPPQPSQEPPSPHRNSHDSSFLGSLFYDVKKGGK